MNWIIIGVIVLLAQKQNYATIYGMANPLPAPGTPRGLNPYIRHWEVANFNRATLTEANQQHVEQQLRRRKRDLNLKEFGPANAIKLNFFAHDREFRLALRQDPTSVFATDVEIENTLGPVDYDVSRIYTGSLEDDENSHVHAILTSDNLLDGTITTNSEQFYVEPSHRYSDELPKAGIHSIVYKLSDVKMERAISPTLMAPTNSVEHCASEKLRKKILESGFRTRRKPDFDGLSDNTRTLLPDRLGYDDKVVSSSYNRHKRWLPDELSDNHQNPPLPLDLDVPYNADFNLFNRNPNGDRTSSQNGGNSYKYQPPSSNNGYRPNGGQHSNQGGSIIRSSFDIGTGPSFGNGAYTKINRNRNIIVSDYNPNPGGSDYNVGTHLSNLNILVNSFNSSNNKFNNNNNNNNNNNFYNNNYDNYDNSIRISNINGSDISNSVSGSSTSRPSHKTHVEIITKNGATKKPNIIVNNYNPDVILTSQNYNSHLSLNVRNDISDVGTGKSSYDKKSTCMLYLQADHTFFQKMGSDEASIEAITRHVQRANAIYKNTDFNGDGKPDNITFMIKRIKVHNMNALKDPTYRFPGNYGVEKFLELFSEEDYDAFCLAYMFTYRDFEMGTLGLAWTGDLKNAGGVCEKNGHYRGSLKSLNTGIVTLLNYGKHVPPAVSHVTLAHEIGHNFGSPHDPEQCTPGGEDGNYIMFARATSGDKRNNNKFSPCSLKSIEPVLNAKARSAKGCFTEPQQSICGNGVVEPGEQCDCGWEEDCKDSCCFPMSRHPRLDEIPCTLTPRAMCSPSQGPCCTTDCALKFGDKCRDDNGCRDPSFCDGRMPQCPPSVNKPNKTICNKEFVCYMGECTGSICLAYGLESCQCLPGPNDPKTKSCELCCKLPGESSPCKSSFEWNEPPFDVPDMFAKPGTPCNDYNGYCDVFQKCREVDPSGPLATLRKLLLSEESIASFKKWFQTNWYTVALAVVGVIVLLILSTKLLGKRSNLKLKSVTIIHSATTETVRLPEDNNGVIVHTAVRTKVPFKKKVRGERSKGAKVSSKTAPQPVNTTNIVVTSNSKGTGIVTGKATKRHSGINETPKKMGRKKNRVSAPVGAEEQTKLNELKKNKKNKKHKEVIDYSGNSASGTHTNTFGKVQKWLLESPIVSQPLSQIEHSSKVRKIMSKSQSTPERLVQKSPKKTKSVGNLSNEKVKLQVVYKPPFKFSLKLSKNSTVKTHVIGGGLGRSKRKTRSGDKKRVAAAPLGTGSNKLGERRRAALLVRTIDDNTNQMPNTDVSEPNYETLNPKSKDNPHYENMNKSSTASSDDQQQSIDSKEPKPSTSTSDPFHINRSTSNSNLARQNSQIKSQSNSYNRSNSLTTSTAHASSKHLSSRKNSENSMNLSRNFGSTQNLIQSSQGNISKSKNRNSLNLKSSTAHDQNRSNLANVPTKRSSSNVNLKRENSSSNLIKSSEITTSKGNLARNSSSSNLKSSSSLSRGSVSNIPRASLSNAPTTTAPAFARQTSLQVKPVPPANNSNLNLNLNANNNNNINNSNLINNTVSNNLRPHTAACDDVRQFEWPKVFSKTSNSSRDRERERDRNDRRNNEDPLPSDLEVMVSDVENLVS